MPRRPDAEMRALFDRFMHMRRANPDLTPAQIARHLGVGAQVVRKWIAVAAEQSLPAPAVSRPQRSVGPGLPPGVYEFCDPPGADWLGESLLEAWDAASECKHGRVAAQACEPCGRDGAATYPGIHALTRAERRLAGSLPPLSRQRSLPGVG